MPTDKIARLRELEAKATPAPWDIDHDARQGGADQIVEFRSGRTLTIAFGTSNGNEDDLPLIVSVRNALPHLLAIAEAAKHVATSAQIMRVNGKPAEKTLVDAEWIGILLQKITAFEEAQ